MSEQELIAEQQLVAAQRKITAWNDSNREVIFSVFRAGDNGIPYYHREAPGHGQVELEIGDFTAVGIGVQVQSGGRWVGDDPKNPPYCTEGQTFTFSVKRGC